MRCRYNAIVLDFDGTLVKSNEIKTLAFGELYNYEPDEQSNETQDKSIIRIEKRSPGDWIKEVFGIHYERTKLFPAYKN